LGHTKIGYLFSGEAYNRPETERLDGLKNALLEAGLDLARLYEVGNNRLEGGESAAKIWLADQDRPTAIFCSNDLLAMGLIHALVQAGVRVPADVSVVGHDDIPFADLFSVPLTTIAFPKSEMGAIAAQILLERLGEERRFEGPQHVVLAPQLIVRSSCGA
jgi:DNA-binding LacI/PurR family transcriptional regulator